MIEVVTEEMHGSDRDSDLNGLRASLGCYGTYFYQSEMALISEWMEQCGKKVLDNAGIVREAMLRQLRHVLYADAQWESPEQEE